MFRSLLRLAGCKNISYGNDSLYHMPNRIVKGVNITRELNTMPYEPEAFINPPHSFPTSRCSHARGVFPDIAPDDISQSYSLLFISKKERAKVPQG